MVHDPMDLSTVERKLTCGEYSTSHGFISDMRLIFDNSYQYNGKGTQVSMYIYRRGKYVMARVNNYVV